MKLQEQVIMPRDLLQSRSISPPKKGVKENERVGNAAEGDRRNREPVLAALTTKKI